MSHIQHAKRDTWEPRRFRAPWIIFWAALLVRILYMTLAHTYRFRVDGDHFQFGWEAGRIARSLATGHGYGNPFHGQTGPTTWLAPLFPLLLGGVFKVFGVYTLMSAWVILALNCIFSALTTLTTYEIGARCCNRRVALWAAWLWALYPAAMQYAVRWVWEMTLSTWLFSCVLVLALRMRQIGEPDADAKSGCTLRRWLLFGLLWGLIALNNPSLLLFLPAAGLWIVWSARGNDLRRQVLYAVASAAIFLACVSPWMVRNTLVFHRFIPFRANFGAEFALGNGPGAHGFLMEYNQPHESRQQFLLYSRMGEVAYARMRGDWAMRFVRSNPALFLDNSLKRFYFFWFSVPSSSQRHWYLEPVRVLNFAFASVAGLLGLALALKRRVPGAWLFFWAFALVPLLYYFVTVGARFRHPLEPIIAVLGVYLFQATEKRPGRRNLTAEAVDGAR